MHLDEAQTGGPDALAHGVAGRPVRRDQRDECDEPRVREERCDLAHTAHVLVAVLRAEPEIAVEAVPQVVAVEQVGGPAALHQAGFDLRGHRRLARARQAREPHHQTFPTGERCALGATHLALVPDDAGGAHEAAPPRIIPAPTVAFVDSSTRMNEPVSRLRR